MARKQQEPTKAEAQAARARIRARNTKPPGLVVRENELRQAQAELRTLRATGVARGGQISTAQAAVDRANTQVERQRAAATRAGRKNR